jgi:hypothetical protein
VSIFFLYRQVLFQYVTLVIVLQNAAKHGKLMESYGNFGTAKFGAVGDGVSHGDIQYDSLYMRSVAKNE